MRRGFVYLLAALFVCAPLRAADAKQQLKIRPYVFASSKGEKVDAELGTFFVPENRSNPDSAQIELAFVRFKSTAIKPGNPIVYLAGGPGGSGVGAAKGSRFPLFMALREVADVIAYDQRGTGMSKPYLGCDEPALVPLDATSRQALIERFREVSRECAAYYRDWQRIDLPAYNTNESADDLEALRRVLGAKKIDLWAISYGTHLALTTIRRHPSSIGHAIIAGTEGPDHTLKLPGNVDAHLAAIGGVLERNPQISEKIPDFVTLVRSVLDKLDKEPAVAEVVDPTTKQKVKVPVNKFVLQLYTATNIGTTTIRHYPAIYYAASKGDFTAMGEWWLSTTRDPIGNAMSYMMDCSSGATAARRERIAAEAKTAILGNLADYVFPDVCTAWGDPDLGDAFRAPVRSDVPALFISGTLDGRTPITNAEEYAAGFANAHHLILDGAVHSDPLFLSSPKIKDAMIALLRDEPLPARMTVAVDPPQWAPLK
jgi:pimeloyl-ACP methyl ester carboxylesterase